MVCQMEVNRFELCRLLIDCELIVTCLWICCQSVVKCLPIAVRLIVTSWSLRCKLVVKRVPIDCQFIVNCLSIRANSLSIRCYCLLLIHTSIVDLLSQWYVNWLLIVCEIVVDSSSSICRPMRLQFVVDLLSSVRPTIVS